MALYHVAVGSVEQIVVVIETVLRDTVVHEVVVEVEVDHQFLGEHVIDERHIVGLLHIEVGVTIGKGDGVGLVHIGVQIRDTGAADAHIVGKSEVAALRKGVLQAGGRHETSVTGAEVLTVAQMIFHVLPGVFVAQSSLHTELIEVTCIFAIASQHGVLVFVFGAGARIIGAFQVIL